MRNYRIYYMNPNDYKDMWVYPVGDKTVALKCGHMDETLLPSHIQYYLNESNSDVYTVQDSDVTEYKGRGFVIGYGDGLIKYYESLDDVINDLEEAFNHMRLSLAGTVKYFKESNMDAEYKYYNNELKEQYDSISGPKPEYEEWMLL